MCVCVCVCVSTDLPPRLWRGLMNKSCYSLTFAFVFVLILFISLVLDKLVLVGVFGVLF